MTDQVASKFSALLLSLVKERLTRLNSRLRGSGRALDLDFSIMEDTQHVILKFRTKEETGSVVLPHTRQDEYGNWLLGDRSDRVLCPAMIVVDGRASQVSHEQMIIHFLFSNISEMYPEQGQKSHIDRILWGFFSKRGRFTSSLCQRFLNSNLFNAMPLSGTPLQDWAMNRRLMIHDPSFSKLRPDDKLEYQRRKNELLHPWGSIGLSDGAAATNNYILQADLREYTAFGRHHNPIRNLYSTLGMKGDEKALVISKPMAELESKGIVRSGWNLMTCFLDVPPVFEDQILVDRRHADKKVSYKRSLTVFGLATVAAGDKIYKGKSVGTNADGSDVIFDIDCEEAKVLSVSESVVPFDGLDEPAMIVIIEATYFLKEGFKITNQHGNKGIIALADLGTVYDPIRGPIPIDVVVSAKSIQKRKNFGQVLEALTTLIHGPSKRHFIPVDLEVTEEQLASKLEKSGFSSDGTCAVTTPWGEFRTLCGWVHWGVTKTPEEQLWEGEDTWMENQRGLRTRGNKVSTIELKALTTLFGPKSGVVGELLSYQQGSGEVRELLLTLDGMRARYNNELEVVAPDKICYIPSGLGTFHGLEKMYGTVADERTYPQGCYILLPFKLQLRVPNEPWGEVLETIAGSSAYEEMEGYSIVETDRLLVPSFGMRQPWLHPTGKYGMSQLGTYLNQILEGIDRFKLGELKEAQLANLVYRYFHNVAHSLSTKVGKISTYLMSVRHPWSSKATASLSPDLETNWIEIHSSMAKDLRVMPGDYVLVERFPCLGFMSVRIQRVRITNDPQCRYVIRVSGNSLVSMNLDFDGDVLYVMSFHTEAAKKELKENFHNPHPRIAEELAKINGKKVPMTRAMSLPELELRSFKPMDAPTHAELNARSMAVKLYTGPVIALCYDLMRIAEGSFPYTDREAHINVELFLDKVGNSVFSQKHGNKSLREECIEAVCLADAKALVNLGFPERESAQLCLAIRRGAETVGVRTEDELRAHYERHLSEGRSNIIKAIVRKCHKPYFATRANLHPIRLLEHLESKPNDLASHLIRRGLNAN